MSRDISFRDLTINWNALSREYFGRPKSTQMKKERIKNNNRMLNVKGEHRTRKNHTTGRTMIRDNLMTLLKASRVIATVAASLFLRIDYDRIIESVIITRRLFCPGYTIICFVYTIQRSAN